MSRCSECKIVKDKMKCMKLSDRDELKERINSKKSKDNESIKKHLEFQLGEVEAGIEICEPIK